MAIRNELRKKKEQQKYKAIKRLIKAVNKGKTKAKNIV